MFGWFGKKEPQAERGDDCAWMTDAARVEGLRREAERLSGEGRNVVVVAHTMAAFDRIAQAFAPREPLLVRDMFERDTLRRRLEGDGPGVAVAMSSALPGEANAGSNAQGEFLVFGRNDRRSADDAIVRAADLLGPGVRVTFHLSLDDPLLQEQGKSLKPMLEKIGMSADEPVTSPFLTRAIENMQKK